LIRTSVIIPNYNRTDALLKTLSGLAAQTVPADQFEVILVDDGSTDDIPSAIRSLSLPFASRLLRQENQGPGAARNRGAELATGDLLIFLDADMIPASELIQHYRAAFAAHPDAILIGRQLPWTPAYESRFERIFNYVNEGGLGSEAFELQFYHLASGNFAVPKSKLVELGGFDEHLRMTEDTDLGYRAFCSGTNLVYVPEAIGYHNHSKTFRQLCREVQASAWWTAQMMKKHPEMQGTIPTYRDLEPINFGSDSPQLIRRKIARRILALRGMLALQEIAVKGLTHLTQSRKLHLFFYWKILACYRLIGFRKGLRASSIRSI